MVEAFEHFDLADRGHRELQRVTTLMAVTAPAGKRQVTYALHFVQAADLLDGHHFARGLVLGHVHLPARDRQEARRVRSHSSSSSTSATLSHMQYTRTHP